MELPLPAGLDDKADGPEKNHHQNAWMHHETPMV